MPIGRGVLSGKPHTAAGLRSALVTIQQKVDSSEDGFPVEDWIALPPQDFMSKRDLRADERFAAAQESAFAETQWHGTYRPDMDPDVIDVPSTRRLVYSGRAYDIVTATLIETYQGIEYLTLGGSRIPTEEEEAGSP